MWSLSGVQKYLRIEATRETRPYFKPLPGMRTWRYKNSGKLENFRTLQDLDSVYRWTFACSHANEQNFSASETQ